MVWPLPLRLHLCCLRAAPRTDGPCARPLLPTGLAFLFLVSTQTIAHVTRWRRREIQHNAIAKTLQSSSVVRPRRANFVVKEANQIAVSCSRATFFNRQVPVCRTANRRMAWVDANTNNHCIYCNNPKHKSIPHIQCKHGHKHTPPTCHQSSTRLSTALAQPRHPVVRFSHARKRRRHTESAGSDAGAAAAAACAAPCVPRPSPTPPRARLSPRLSPLAA